MLQNQFPSGFQGCYNFDSMRNRITGQLLKAFLNHKIKDFGKMTTLHIDTQEKHISITANLLGEAEPIDASLNTRWKAKAGHSLCPRSSIARGNGFPCWLSRCSRTM